MQNLLRLKLRGAAGYRRLLAIGAAAAAATLATAVATSAVGSSEPTGQGATTQTPAAIECAALSTTDFSGTEGAPARVWTAAVVPASGATREYCRVTGYVKPQVQFELRLPTKSWNGRYLQAGCGGFCGAIGIDRTADALARDFAVAAQNMGHVGLVGDDALWGHDNEELRRDFGPRSTHVVAVASKAIIKAYYGAGPKASYFRGGSTGGREGLYEAEKYPRDFDGIIAGAPAFPGRAGGITNNWAAHRLATDDGQSVFTPATLQLLHDAVMNECDGIDGLRDGIIDDPRRCKFDPGSLACPTASDAADCLTDRQVVSARELYRGPHNSRGQRLSPGGAPYGSELGWSAEINAAFANEYLKHLAFPKSPPASYSYRDFDFDRDVSKLVPMARLYDPVDPYEDPDLRAFKRGGGRLILYHGFADFDTGIDPYNTIDYHAEVARQFGGNDALRGWLRMFLVPGMGHFGARAAPDRFDMLSAIVRWVEDGQAPERIVATQFRDGQVVRTRPLFPYPQVARYDGSGDQNDEANFVPADPPVTFTDDVKWIWDPGAGRSD